jgi:hypothetical protein
MCGETSLADIQIRDTSKLRIAECELRIEVKSEIQNWIVGRSHESRTKGKSSYWKTGFGWT